MDLLPLIVVFILSIFCVLSFFALITYLYFRIKRKTYFLDEQLSPDARLDDPYIQMIPIKNNKSADKNGIEGKNKKQSLINMNLAKMRGAIKSYIPSALFNIPQINNRGSMQTTRLEDSIAPQQKFEFISKIINYRKDKLELFTNQVQTIINKKVFMNLNWQNNYKIQPIHNSVQYQPCDQGFGDLMDIFKLQPDDYCAVKFTVEVIVKDCNEQKAYYISDLPKIQRVETISQSQFFNLKAQFKKL